MRAGPATSTALRFVAADMPPPSSFCGTSTALSYTLDADAKIAQAAKDAVTKINQQGAAK